MTTLRARDGAYLTRLLLALLVGLLPVLLVSCNKNKRKIAPDPEYSLNVMPVPEFWPREEQDWPKDPVAARVQQDYLAEHGRPDFFRVVWRPDRRIIRHFEMMDAIERKGAGLAAAPELEWIYLEGDTVVRFYPRRHEARELDHRLLTHCVYGDPHEVKSNPDPATGRILETYFYYDIGKVYYYDAETGKLVREQPTPPLGRVVRRF